MAETSIPTTKSPPSIAGCGCGDGGKKCCSEGGEATTCPPPESSSSFSAFPVRYGNGEVRLIVEDLVSNGFGVRWGHTRSYSNQLSTQDQGVNGNSWFVRECPQ